MQEKTQAVTEPERIVLAPGLTISRIVTGLWQVADLEKDGHKLDSEKAAVELAAYAEAGFDTFDMADHYGSAEEITGQLNTMVAGGLRLPSGRRPIAFTKWCPAPRPDGPQHRPRRDPRADRPAADAQDRSSAVPLVGVRAPGLYRRDA
jgi:hypothetical protein